MVRLLVAVGALKEVEWLRLGSQREPSDSVLDQPGVNGIRAELNSLWGKEVGP